jgi:hypothetical protein
MSPMLGESVLPEAVNDARRRVRSQVRSLRQPIRQRRESLVPGPDVIGQTETTLMDLRDRVATRDGLLSRVRSQQNMMNSGTDNSENGSDNDSSPTM